MSDTKDTDNEKSAEPGKTMTLSLKRTVDAGHVRQNFSRGRSKSVVVEKKKRRTIVNPGVTAPATPKPETATPPSQELNKIPTTVDARDGALSDSEKDARLRALAAARIREAEEKVRAEEEAELEAERAKKAEEERIRLEADVKPKAETESELKPEDDKSASRDEKPGEQVANIESVAAGATVARKHGTVSAPLAPADPGLAERDQRKPEPRKKSLKEERREKSGGASDCLRCAPSVHRSHQRQGHGAGVPDRARLKSTRLN